MTQNYILWQKNSILWQKTKQNYTHYISWHFMKQSENANAILSA